jgi:predicted glycoside hydrolase/deacetylase ChbG (UPF0249 family)
MLDGLRPGQVYELMCHPGLRPTEPDVQRWAYGHEVELHTLTSPSTQADITARGIQLCNFTMLTDL